MLSFFFLSASTVCWLYSSSMMKKAITNVKRNKRNKKCCIECAEEPFSLWGPKAWWCCWLPPRAVDQLVPVGGFEEEPLTSGNTHTQKLWASLICSCILSGPLCQLRRGLSGRAGLPLRGSQFIRAPLTPDVRVFQFTTMQIIRQRDNEPDRRGKAELMMRGTQKAIETTREARDAERTDIKRKVVYIREKEMGTKGEQRQWDKSGKSWTAASTG